MTAAAFSQLPPIEPGVSQELAKWRAARYSDVRYKLNLTLEKMSPVLKGTMEIRVKVGAGTLLSPTPQGVIPPIILDWRKIRGHEGKSNVSNVTVNGRQAIFPPGTADGDKSVPAPFEESDEHLIFRDGVIIGENVIKLDFTSPILTTGSAITRYVDKEDGTEYIYSLFVPSDASTAFPVFDQPDLKARFTVNVLAPQDWRVISNGEELQTSISSAPDWKLPLHRPTYDLSIGVSKATVPAKVSKTPTVAAELYSRYFNETKPISTYVFAFAAGPFERVETPDGNASVNERGNVQDKIRADNVGANSTRPLATLPNGRVSARDAIYVRKSQAAKFKPHAAEVFRLNREAIKYFEEYFDYKFPFPKYDLVLIPEFPFGGMEHAGATFLRESAVIFPQEPTKNDHISRAVLIFHETAHQWFGDTVTMRWFDDLWLKEGFANFAAYKAMEKIMPEANAWKVFYERIKQGAYQTDSTKGTTPIYQEIKNLSAAKSAYGNIVYNKTPAFLRQVEFYLGEDKFQTAIRAFLKKHEFGNAGWEDLVKEFGKTYGPNSSDWERSWSSWAKFWVTQSGLPSMRVVSDIAYSSIGRNGVSYSLDQAAQFQTGEYWREKVRLLIITESNERIVHDFTFGGVNVGGKPGFFSKAFLSQSIYNPKSVPTYKQISPEIDLLEGRDKPIFIFSNYGDYGYGIFLLDDKSRDYVLKNIQNEKDPFLRSMMWGSLWDSVREGELDPREYVELVWSSAFRRPSVMAETASGNATPAKAGTPNLETDESTIATLLGRTSTALNYYVSEPPAVAGGLTQKSGGKPAFPTATGGVDLRDRVENLLIERIRNAETLGQRITYYRAFLNVAASENGRKVLKGMLLAAADAKRPLTTPAFAKPPATPPLEGGELLPLKTKDKFDIVTRLLILGDPEAEKLLAGLEKTETSDEAKRYAYAAKAGISTAENKAKYWNDFVNNKEISESWIEAAFGPWNSIRHSDLTLPYLERALKELPNHKRSRKIFFINGWLGAFIGGQRSEEALSIVNKFLADNPNLDKDLRLKILENVDVIERAVKIRSKYK